MNETETIFGLHASIALLTNPERKIVKINCTNEFYKNYAKLLKKFNDAGLKLIKKQKIKTIKIKSFFSLDMQFLGQTHMIRIPLPNKLPSKQFIQKSFEEYYFKRFKVKLDKISGSNSFFPSLSIINV